MNMEKNSTKDKEHEGNNYKEKGERQTWAACVNGQQ